jgi:hypothetical protein
MSWARAGWSAGEFPKLAAEVRRLARRQRPTAAASVGAAQPTSGAVAPPASGDR